MIPPKQSESKEDDYDKCIDAYIKSLLGAKTGAETPPPAAVAVKPKSPTVKQKRAKETTAPQQQQQPAKPSPFQRSSRLRKTIVDRSEQTNAIATPNGNREHAAKLFRDAETGN